MEIGHVVKILHCSPLLPQKDPFRVLIPIATNDCAPTVSCLICKSPKTKRSAHVRRGTTVIEITTALVVLAATMSIIVPVVGTLVICRQNAEKRHWAVQETSNIMERITSQVWEQVTPESVQNLQLSEQAREMLPQGKLNVRVEVELDDSAAKRVTAVVSWRTMEDALQPVRLTAWIYRRRAG